MDTKLQNLGGHWVGARTTEVQVQLPAQLGPEGLAPRGQAWVSRLGTWILREAQGCPKLTLQALL